ncbi:FAD-dependent 5-carboxymethylaminomethyl-2-thiouridine(34) oxidoreductase MnmC [uncultured Hyphomonas sp.]|uniref:FAD-dependent 5-carboxymethylaminomethyl-2-thiouridine(34) oxidoreductase MnmC n=1 Tax=uncultured Hyphomonas sp. TaxID=225298 RepID=UPI002AAAC31F|nr:FAD-dependent 5-carboxymethylaminomethyl-2-thiouridine(34) oxidoreductase MnmC [uncultured Hyphomonas sp.]
MTRLLTQPEIDWKDDGTPVARAAGDVYFTAGDGLGETRAVFLAGCSLPEAWTGREAFTIAETGFGTGLNFLAAWDLWRANRPSPTAFLHFVSYEGFPLAKEDAERALSAWPELAGLSERLIAVWPGPVRGVRHFVWPEDGVTLTLHLADIAESFPDSVYHADAWFLDGFSPARNEAMWAADLFKWASERSVPGAQAATFTVAGAVRRGLADAGFSVAKAPGHGRKRERLEARLATPPAPQPDVFGLSRPLPRANRIAILGAGIAGANAAHALTQLGAESVVFDPADGPATGGSGNPMGLVMPRLDAGDTAQARLLVDAYLAARHTYQGRPGVTETDVRQVPKDAAETARFEKLLADPPLPLEDLEALSGGGLLHKRALIVEPAKLIPSLLDGVEQHYGEMPEVSLAARTVNGTEFDAIILANGMAAGAMLPWLGLEARMGQVDFTDGPADAPPFAMASGTYALALGLKRLWGATFDKVAPDTAPFTSDAAREENLKGVEALSPYWIRDATGPDIASRASLRATTTDRLPLIGAVPDHEAFLETFAGMRKGRPADADAPLLDRVFVSSGFGARGFTWGPWAGSVLAARLCCAPAPASRSALEAVAPARLLLRALKRGRA